MRHPNIFDFATSELSQDAFLCWLLDWANPKYSQVRPDVHGVAQAFVRRLYAKCRCRLPNRVDSVEIRPQYKNIDVVAFINGTDIIAIEDKTHIREHSGQLLRYLTALEPEKRQGGVILLVYVQTGDQSDYSKVVQAGFVPFLRPELIELLGSAGSETDDDGVLAQFLDHLKRVEAKVQAYLITPLEKWDSLAWRGFYTRLQQELGEGNWAYVPNPSGGFMGFYWFWKEAEQCKPYLQLEEEKLCFKIQVDDPDQEVRTLLKKSWHKRIVLLAQADSLPVVLRPRLRNGRWMTVALIEGHYRRIDAHGNLDLPQTLHVMRQAQAVLARAVGQQAK